MSQQFDGPGSVAIELFRPCLTFIEVLFFSHSFFGKPKWHGIVTRSQMCVVEYGDLCVRHMRDYAIPL